MSDAGLIWTQESERECLQTRVFRVVARRMRSPDRRFEDDFFVLDTADWVNIVAVTPNGEFILVRQFRFGTLELSLEVPGGIVDPDEAYLDAARRELLEETGYVSAEWRHLFTTTPNPALNTNRCAVFLAQNCEPLQAAEGDDYEFMETVLVSADRYFERLAAGEIHHALTVAALSTALCLRG